jgi:type VI secretion system secreted protein VgrG
MQPPRLLGIKTPLGEGAMLLVRLSVTEQLGAPYTIEAEVLSERGELMPKDLLTRQVICAVRQRTEGAPRVREFCGVVAGFSRLGPRAGRMAYRLQVVPKLWTLGLRRDCRIFQEKTVKEIVTEVLADHGLAEPSWSMLGAIKPIPYCTQFNETDLAFVSRLLEEHGLTYFFTHGSGGEEMGVAHTASGFPQSVVGDVFALHGEVGLQGFGSWRRDSRVRSAATALEDMDAERVKPSDKLNQRRVTRRFDDEGDMWVAAEDYHWPGGMSTRPGNPSAEVAMGAEEAGSERYSGSALDPRHLPGTRLSVAVRQNDGSEQKRQYLVAEVTHHAVDESGLGAGMGGTESYGATVGLVLASRVWMPAQRHPRPVMPGLQSARVTGPAGEKINVDKLGRVKVKFRWDRAGKDDDSSSCWLRVMQSAAGAWGGTWFLPRVGDEVLVAFLEGDPDRPLVVGSVYGQDAIPPFAPGTNKAQSGILTRSYKSDSASDANMFRFEDKKGSEEVMLHAQKDLTVEVENDETRRIDHDQTETIKNKRTVTIDQSDDILTLTQGNRTITIKMGNQDTTVEMGNVSMTVSMGNESHSLKLGNFALKCDLGAITLEAMQSITLKVGQSSVVVDQLGVTTKGMMIQSEAQLLHKLKTLMLQEKADAVAMIEGGIVMIN